MNVEVTSATKREQKLSSIAAAIYVISQEDIRRSGATNIPEALRMVPGVVENGLFLGLADVAFVAGPKGLEVIEAESLEDDA